MFLLLFHSPLLDFFKIGGERGLNTLELDDWFIDVGGSHNDYVLKCFNEE
jgi:hypothetical protein